MKKVVAGIVVLAAVATGVAVAGGAHIPPMHICIPYVGCVA